MATYTAPLSVPDITLVATRPTVTGLTVTALDGSFAHGNRIRIEAEASYNIGPKTQAAPRHWQMGSDIRLNGVAAGSEVVGGAPDTTEVWSAAEDSLIKVSDAYVRHANVDTSYVFTSNAVLSTPQTFLNISAAEGNRYYQAFRTYPGHKFSVSRNYAISNINGTFDLDPDRRRGEVISIDTGAVVGEAYVTHIQDGYITFESIDGNASSTGLEGATVTGLTSGATATLGAYAGSPWSTKLFRVHQEGRLEPGTRITTSYNAGGQISIITRDEAGNIGGDYYVSEYPPGPDPDDEPMQWHLVELVVDFSGAVGKIYYIVDGVVRYVNESYPADRENPNFGYRIGTIGLDLPGFSLPNDAQGFMLASGEWYFDNDSRRLYICDADTYAGTSEREIIRPEAWTENPDGSVVIDAVLYQGAFTELTGKYLALVDGNTVIFEGVSL